MTSEICIAPLETLTLMRGSHAPGEGQYCAVEAAVCRFSKGEKHGDDSRLCNGSLIIGRLLIKANDQMSDLARQSLKEFVALLPNSFISEELELRRRFKVIDWAIRFVVPKAMDAIGADNWADELRGLKEVVDSETQAIGESWCRFAAYAAHAAANDAYAAANDAAYAAHAAANDAYYAYYAAANVDIVNLIRILFEMK